MDSACPLCGGHGFEKGRGFDESQNLEASLLQNCIYMHLRVRILSVHIGNVCSPCRATVFSWDRFAKKCWEIEESRAEQFIIDRGNHQPHDRIEIEEIKLEKFQYDDDDDGDDPTSDENLLGGQDATLREDPAGPIGDPADVLPIFIASYEELPVLWNQSDPDYRNKFKRKAALTKLQSIYQRIKPGATTTDVRHKINSLRSNYRRELKKIEDSKEVVKNRTGLKVYSPASSTFHALTFLGNLEKPADTGS